MPLNLGIKDAIDCVKDAYYYVEDFLDGSEYTYVKTFDISLIRPLHIINSYLSNFIVPSFEQYEYETYSNEGHKQVLLFSGGKISTAVASILKRKEKDIILLYYKNVDDNPNNIKPKADAVTKLADELDMDLIIIPIGYNKSNPLFMMYLIAETVNQITAYQDWSFNILTGLFYGTSIYNNQFESLAYSREFIEAEKNLFCKVISEFNISMPIPSMSFAWDELMRRKEVIPYLICEDEVDRITSYIIQSDYDIIEPDEEKYLKYFRRLKNIYRNEIGINSVTDKEVWKRYFFYNMSYSKFLEHSS